MLEPQENKTDAELVLAARTGDQKALEALVVRHLSAAYSICLRYLRNSADAEDATQLAFVKAWKALARFDEQRNFRAWIVTIAKNTCLDFLKQSRTIPFSAFSEDPSELFADSSPTPHQLAEQGSTASMITTARETLSSKYREVLNLYHDQGLNFREIAKILREPLNTVKSRHRRAIIELRKYLSE